MAFMSNQLGERGTEVSLYDYAHYNEKILNNVSIIIYFKNAAWNSPRVIEKFNKRFNVVIAVTDKSKVEDVLTDNNVDIFYHIHSGGINDGIMSKVAKNCVHAVFRCQKHGDAYASVSKYVCGNNNTIDVVPHMVSLPDNKNDLRQKFGIPIDALVIAGYGGKDSFDIPYVHETVREIAQNNSNIYFLFANFERFSPPLANLIYVDTIVDLEEKVAFINTADAMLWGRSEGETFGIAIAEFSSKNKPVIAAKVGWCQAHVEFLRENGLWYHDGQSLKEIILGLRRDEIKSRDWNMYKEFTPAKVMAQFKKVFIDPFFSNNK